MQLTQNKDYFILYLFTLLTVIQLENFCRPQRLTWLATFGLRASSLTRALKNLKQRTTQLMQRLLGVGVPVAALPDVVGFQFNAGLDGCDWLVAGLQVNAGEQGQAARARLVFDPLVEAWETKPEKPSQKIAIQ